MDGRPEIRWHSGREIVLPTDLEGPPEARPFRVWHMALLVLAAALILGGVVGLRDEAKGSPMASGRLIAAVIATFAAATVGSARGLTRWTQGPLHRLGFWGVCRGGLAGFVASLVVSMAGAAILVGSLAIGLFLGLGLAWVVLDR